MKCSLYFKDTHIIPQLSAILKKYIPKDREIIILCIGTDRSTGDALGPLVGSLLNAMNVYDVYGTIDAPVHAMNLVDVLAEVHSKYYRPFIIAVDASLGASDRVGYIVIEDAPLTPGLGVNKTHLPEVGDISIYGIVNVGGFMEYSILASTRLHLVISMAHIIAQALYNSLKGGDENTDINMQEALLQVCTSMYGS